MGTIISKITKAIFPFRYYSLRSYSQTGEDMVMRSIMGSLSNKSDGFYVDVGSHDPFRYSNTCFFYKSGWHGINIEPTPLNFKNMVKHRKRDINLNIIVSEESKSLTFYLFDEPALNTANRQRADELVSTTNHFIVGTQEIKSMSLFNVFEQYLPKKQSIDFITVDAEGSDLSVLKSNNWEKYRPTYVLCEDLGFEKTIEKGEISHYMESVQYKMIAKTKLTCIFMDELV